MSVATVLLRERVAELEAMARAAGSDELISACALTAKVAIELDERIAALESRRKFTRREFDPHPS